MKARWWAAGGAIAVLTAVFAAIPDNHRVPSESEKLYRSALVRLDSLDPAGAARELRALLFRDPSYLPAVFELDLLADIGSPNVAATLDSIASIVRDAGFAECLRTLARNHRSIAPEAVDVSSLSPEARLCFAAAKQRGAPLRDAPSTADLDELSRRYGWAPAVAKVAWAAEAKRRDWSAGGIEWMRDRPAWIAGELLAYQATELHLAGNNAVAFQLERQIEQDPRWASRGFRFAYFFGLVVHEQLLHPTVSVTAGIEAHTREAIDRSWKERLALASTGSPTLRAETLNNFGFWLSDHGRINESVTRLAEAARIADSARLPLSGALAHVKLGRALAKAGRIEPAERELRMGAVLSEAAGSVAYAKEAQHNLLHLYDAAKQDAKAHEAGREFVRLATISGLNAQRMMSKRDLALFLRSRGRLEEARPYIAGMLADIDSLNAEYVFAAEYYESIGDVDRAEHYYQAGLSRDQTPIRPLAGLLRIALAKGQNADAIDYARRHDRQLTVTATPESEALLPRTLLALGRRDEGRAALHASRTTAHSNGRVAAWASLTLSLAEADLSDGRLEAARALADSAAGAAMTVGANQVALRARAVAATASIRLGSDPRAARSIVARAVAEASRSGDSLFAAQMHRLAGEALADGDEWRSGLHQFARAADILDRIALEITLDPDRAGFRSAHRNAYDGALAAIVAHSSRDDAVGSFLAWSRRRKERGIANGAAGAMDGRIHRPPAGEAIIDYVVLDRQVAAAIITSSGAELVVLPIGPDTLRRLIVELRSRTDVRIGTRLDLLHAGFPTDVARRLHDALLAPVVARIASPVSSLVIVPDGPLHLVPFDALVTGMDSAKQPVYVVDRYAVRHALTSGRGPPAIMNPGAVVAVAPMQHGVDGSGEVDALLSRFGRRVRSLRGAAATESAVRNAVAGASILHFAAHARANDVAPAMSALYLTPESPDDGALHSFEIARLPLNGATVVMSACETAGGRVLEAEGVLSLSRSFFQAGARETVATLWPVGDDATVLMRAFYGSLADDRDAARALRRAKLDARTRGQPPLAWAAFITISRVAVTER